MAPACLDLAHEQGTRAHQAFLVGETDDRAAADGGERGGEPGGPDDTRHHPVRLPAGGFDQSFAARRALDSRSAQCIFKRTIT